jgi:hypothetical protein
VGKVMGVTVKITEANPPLNLLPWRYHKKRKQRIKTLKVKAKKIAYTLENKRYRLKMDNIG